MVQSLLVLPLAAAPKAISSYEDIFVLLRDRGPTHPATLIAVGLLGLLCIVIFVGGYVASARRGRKAAWRLFDEIAREKRLTRQEDQLLWRMARAVKLRSPVDVLTSHTAFERGLDACIRGSDDVDEDLIDVIRYKLGFHHLPLGWALKSTRQLPDGQRLLVGFKEGSHTRFRGCILIESLAEGLLVAPHTREDVRAFDRLSPNDTVYVRFWRRGDTEYQFRTSVVTDDDARHELVLDHSDALKRVERRDYYRLEYRARIRLFLEESGESGNGNPDPIDATAESVSAGGLSVFTRRPIEAGEVRIDPRHQGPVSLAGLRCLRLRSEQEPKGWRHMLEFVDLPDSHRDLLVRQIFEQQTRKTR